MTAAPPPLTPSQTVGPYLAIGFPPMTIRSLIRTAPRSPGVPFNVIVAAVLALLVGAMVRRTIVGRQLVAVGGNREASVLAGVPVKRTLFAVYVISGVLAAIAGLLLTGRSGAANPAYIGLDYELFAITAVVVGGTPLTGGRIRVFGTVMGALLMQLVSTTLVSHNLTDSDRRIVTALIIVAAVALQRSRRPA